MDTIIWQDVEVMADREADLELLFAELDAEDEEAIEPLPEIIIFIPSDWDNWGEAA